MSKNSGKTKSPLRMHVEHRMEFIEFRLFWEGQINRADLTAQFGVSAPQASNDLSAYKEIAGDNIEYDLSKKCYLAAKKFTPRFLKPDANQYLSQLKLVADELVSPQDSWIFEFPNVDIMPTFHRHVDTEILKRLLVAVRNKTSVHVLYQSMNEDRPTPVWRHITPHAFFHDGMRWHIRAFCHIGSKFKDFLLSRFVEIGNEGSAAASAAEDTEWNEFIDIILIPNPKLSEGQQQMIAQDYGMNNAELRVRIRKDTLFYFKRRHRLDIVDLLPTPQEVPIVIKEIVRTGT